MSLHLSSRDLDICCGIQQLHRHCQIGPALCFSYSHALLCHHLAEQTAPPQPQHPAQTLIAGSTYIPASCKALTTGLHSQTAVMTAVGPLFGLSRIQACRAGLLLAAGGEFAFVAL